MNDAKIRRRRFLAAGPLMLWTDPKFDTNVAEANAVAEKDVPMASTFGMRRVLAASNAAHSTVPRCVQPYGRGLDSNVVDTYPFKYARIDTKWRLQ
jgi:hypothetical protein